VAGQVQGKNNQEPKQKKSTVVSSKKKWTVMNLISRRMKKRSPSSGQNGQLVHWWLLVHSGLPQVLWNGPYHLGAIGLATIPLGRNWFYQNLLRSVPGFPRGWDKGHSLVHRTKS
jgi:hypothetical protein